jgi:hypothetical protein
MKNGSARITALRIPPEDDAGITRRTMVIQVAAEPVDVGADS